MWLWWAIDRRGALEELGLWRPTVVGGVGVRVVAEVFESLGNEDWSLLLRLDNQLRQTLQFIGIGLA